MTTTTRPYYYIRAWGYLLGSFEYFILGEIQNANADNAPETAIYKNHDDPRRWVTFEEIEDPHTKQKIANMVADLRDRTSGSR